MHEKLAKDEKYSMWKRELYGVVVFVIKYDYFCKHPYLPAVVHTDHKPLVYFLSSDLHERIYGHWAETFLAHQLIRGMLRKFIADLEVRQMFLKAMI